MKTVELKRSRRLALEKLEAKITPTISLNPISLFAVSPTGTVSVAPVSTYNEGDVTELHGTYRAIGTIGNLALQVNWGDGVIDNIPLVPGSASGPATLPLVNIDGSPIRHRFVDD